jgi:hypothetical protein
MNDHSPVTSVLLCSAKGCRAVAAWALSWNNPKLHAPERRKVWLACPEHRASLGDFLSARGFLREVTPADSTPGARPTPEGGQAPDPAATSAPARPAVGVPPPAPAGSAAGAAPAEPPAEPPAGSPVSR